MEIVRYTLLQFIIDIDYRADLSEKIKEPERTISKIRQNQQKQKLEKMSFTI